MRLTIIAFSLLLSSLILPKFVLAQTPAISITMAPTQTEAKPNNGRELGQNIKKVMENRLSKAEKREEIKELIELKKNSMLERREDLKKKIETFKDERRKNMIIKIDEKIASISSKRTQRMNDAVDKLDDILSNIKSKADEIVGCDKTALNLAIAEAESALASASAAVETQAGKTYTINIVTEDSAKVNVGSTIKTMTGDLRTTHQLVMKAKRAVVKAAVELRKLKSCTKASITAIPTIQSTPSATIVPTNTVIPTSVTPTGSI